MFSESLRRRLEQLNRGVAASASTRQPCGMEPDDATRAIGPPARAPSGSPRGDRLGAQVPLPQLPLPTRRDPHGMIPVENLPELQMGPAGQPLPGREVVTSAGCHWWIQRPLQEVWLLSEEVLGRAQSQLASGDVAPAAATDGRVRQRKKDPLREEYLALRTAFPGKVLVMDLETCGLAGATIFLVGLLCPHEGGFVQLWARDYSEEKAILQTFWEIAGRYDVLLTFNGKTFDWPQVHARSTVHRLGRDPSLLDGISPASDGTGPSPLPPHVARPQLVHFDLLHQARRRWKSQLPNCRLQTLERHFCGRSRFDDIPGRLIPAAYQDYVRTGDTRQVRRILQHNLLDLLTLLQVTVQWIRAETGQCSTPSSPMRRIAS